MRYDNNLMQFVWNADEATVADLRERREAAEEESKRLKTMLSQLSADHYKLQMNASTTVKYLKELKGNKMDYLYMVSVDGSTAPLHEHSTYNSARAESERLSRQPANKDRKIRVLAIIDVLEPQYMHKWKSEKCAAPF